MQTSLFLAKLIGPIFLAVGVGALINGDVYRGMAEEFLRSRALIYVSGLLTMTAGMAVILSHNVWAPDWRVVISLLGWLAAIGGAVRIVLPQVTERFGRSFLRRPLALPVSGIVWLAVGALLCFYGYFR
jgi:hypothetical protein